MSPVRRQAPYNLPFALLFAPLACGHVLFPPLLLSINPAFLPPPTTCQDPWGHPAHGWGGQAAILSRKYANVSLADRVPQAMWRGRIKDERYPQRDALRWAALWV